jgi:hypothetical protein
MRAGTQEDKWTMTQQSEGTFGQQWDDFKKKRGSFKSCGKSKAMTQEHRCVAADVL